MMALLSLTIMLIVSKASKEPVPVVSFPEWFPVSVESMVSDFEGRVDWAVKQLSSLGSQSLESVSNLAEHYMNLLSVAVEGDIKTIEEKISEQTEEIAETLEEPFKEISDKMTKSVKDVSEAIHKGIEDATDSITETIGTITDTVTGVVTATSKTIKDILNPDEGSVKGDPHFRMWGVNNNSWFPYQGECDLVLVDNPTLSTGKTLKIYVRTKIKSYYSYVESVAIQIDEEVLEVQGGKNEVFVNGKATKQTPTLFAGYQIKEANTTKWCRSRENAGSVIKKIYLGDDGKIIVVNCFGFLYVDVQARGLGFLNSRGLMGKRDKPGKFARNGTILFNNIFFAEEWQVLSTEPKLFHVNRHPQHPTQCISPPKQVQRRLGSRRRIANMACSDLSGGALKACIYDIEATGNVGMAIPYSLRG